MQSHDFEDDAKLLDVLRLFQFDGDGFWEDCWCFFMGNNVTIYFDNVKANFGDLLIILFTVFLFSCNFIVVIKLKLKFIQVSYLASSKFAWKSTTQKPTLFVNSYMMM